MQGRKQPALVLELPISVTKVLLDGNYQVGLVSLLREGRIRRGGLEVTMLSLKMAMNRATLVCAFATLMISQASALICYFDYTDGVNVASGVLDAIDNGDGSLTAVSGTISVTGGAAAGVYPLIPNPIAPATNTSPMGAFFYDNQLFPAADPLLTTSGLLFGSGGIEVNIWGNGAGNPYSFYAWNGANYFVENNSGSFHLECVPEPASMAAVGLGLAALIRRRKKVTG